MCSIFLLHLVTSGSVGYFVSLWFRLSWIVELSQQLYLKAVQNVVGMTYEAVLCC